MTAAAAEPTLAERTAGLKQDLHAAMRDHRFDDLRRAYDELTEACGADPDSDEMLPSRVLLGMYDGRLRDMLRMLNGLGEDRALGLKAVCLQLIGDPLWEGLATQVLETSPREAERRSMQALVEMGSA